MRLLRRDSTGELRLADDPGDGVTPRYAILSHTWEDGQEVTFQGLQNGTVEEKSGWKKLQFCAEKSKEARFDYFWVDTCCIDKSSSAELQEALNSMFRWYSEAGLCLVYLSDVENSQRWKTAFRKSRWFTRGWTLQELLAPDHVEFYSKEGTYLGSKRTLEETIHEITGISFDALRGKHLSGFSKDERMSWAANRQTKREEDAAYSLFGIFNVFMPVLYGEGRENALKRLHDQVDNEQLSNKHRRYNGDPRKLLEAEEAKREREAKEALKRRKVAMKSLRFNEMDVRHAAIKAAHAETCEWILEQPEFKDWLDAAKLKEHNGFLWIKGKPGAGKSTLMKFILSRARPVVANCRTISYFFNARGGSLEKSTIGTYRSLLWQILDNFPHLTYVLDESNPVKVDQNSSTFTHLWKIETLQRLLSKAIVGLARTPILCFVDALDECEEQQVRDMIGFLEQLGALAVSRGASLRICLASRYYPHITIDRGLSLPIDRLEGHERDVALYLRTALKIGSTPLAHRIRATIQSRASGIFMWVVLVVAILNKEYDHGRVHRLQRTLAELPGGLHELFHDILTRDTNNSEETVLCIRWLLFSRQAMYPQQLHHAILSGAEPQAFAEWTSTTVSIKDAELFILSCSKGLADVVKSTRVQLIHESVREFLLNTSAIGDIWPTLNHDFEGQSHEKLKISCMTYLDKVVLEHDDYRRGLPFPTTLDRDHPFLTYASRHVLHHAELAARRGFDQREFLQKFPLKKWIIYWDICYPNNSFDGASLLYILSQQNLPTLISMHPSNRLCFSLEAYILGSPLSVALGAGHIEVIRTFVTAHIITLRQGSALRAKCEEYMENCQSIPPLLKSSLVHCVVESGHETLLALAIHASKTGLADLDFDVVEGDDEETPLHLAVRAQRHEMVRMLLESGQANADAQDSTGWTPLMCAASNGNFAMAKDLIEIGQADIDIRDQSGKKAWSLVRDASNDRLLQLLQPAGRSRKRQRTLQHILNNDGHEVIVISDDEA